MITILRKNQKALWIVIAFLCIPFIFYFSNSNIGAITGDDFGRIYGRKVTRLEFQHSARLFNLARELGMFSYLQDMVAGAATESDVYNEFTWNRLVLRHEAERLGIQTMPHEIGNVVRDLRPFRGDTGFDLNKYNEFAQNALPAMGFTEAHVEELAGDQLILRKLKDLVGTGVQVSESESQLNYERSYGKISLVLARLRPAEIAKDISISDEDVAKHYEANKEQLKTEEKRKINFVSFALNEEQKQLAGKERVEVLQKLADRANDFNQALLEPGADFHQVAIKFQLPVQITGEFTRAAPDPLLSSNPQLAEAAFKLTPEEPNTDAMQAGDGFYVLNLAGMEPARPLSIDEAKPNIVATLKSGRERELVAAKGAEAEKKIRDAVKVGTPAEAAIQQAGFQPEKVPPFALSDTPGMRVEPGKQPEPESPDLQMIKPRVADLNPGDVTEFIPTMDGGVVAVMERRDRPESGAYEQSRSSFNARFLNSRRQIAFMEWLKERRREAGAKAHGEAEPPAELG